jgi:hypothetical protein
MKCEDYRQAIGAEPAFEDAGEHAAACPACRDYRDEILALDGDIRRALSIRVPGLRMPYLPAGQDPAVLRPRRGLAAGTWLALAATVVVAVAAGVLLSARDGGATLGEQVLAHLDHHPAHLGVTGEVVADDLLESVIPAGVSSLRHQAGVVTYAQSCVINGHLVPHLVVQGRNGPVTIILMPDDPVERAVTLSGDHVAGVILPVGGGSIAIVGGRDEPLEAIEQEVLNSVTWTT